MSLNFTLTLASPENIEAILQVGDDLFDHRIKPQRLSEFLNDERHHLVLALLDGKVIGMASGFHYVHPDKDPNLFINEAGVVEKYQNQGVGRAMVKRLCEHGESLGCTAAWVATENSNLQARKAYIAAGGKEDEELVTLIEFELKNVG